MFDRCLRRCLLLSGALGLVASSQAQVSWGMIERSIEFRQSGADALDFDYGGMSFFLGAYNPRTITRAEVLLPTGEVRPFLNQDPNFFLGSSPASEAAMNALYPQGAYAVRGYIGADRVYEFAVPSTPGFNAASAPRILNYAALQSAQGGKDLQVQVAGYTPLAGSTVQYISYVLDEYVDGTYLRTAVQGGTSTPTDYTFTIDGGLLTAGHRYELRTMSQSNTVSSNAVSGTQSYFAQAHSRMSFTPVPEPASMVTLTLGGLALLRRSRSRKPRR